MPESRPPIDLKGVSLADLQAMIDDRRLPPVDKWDPPLCGSSGIRIARDGRWLHDGRPIDRPAMVRLFSTILRRETDGSHVLVTPVEKLTIDVDETAFRAIEMRSERSGPDRRIWLALDSGDALLVSGANPLSVIETDHGPSPRVAVRHGLEAQLSRSIYYELAQIALDECGDPPGVWSDGCFFPLATSE